MFYESLHNNDIKTLADVKKQHINDINAVKDDCCKKIDMINQEKIEILNQ